MFIKDIATVVEKRNNEIIIGISRPMSAWKSLVIITMKKYGLLQAD